MRYRCYLLALVCLFALWPARMSWAADERAALVFTPDMLRKLAKSGTVIDDMQAVGGQALNWEKPLTCECYSANPVLSLLRPGWYRLALRASSAMPSSAIAHLDFAIWNPVNKPNAFRYQTSFLAQELPAAGQYGEIVRTVHVGERGDQYGMLLRGGWDGLRIDSLKLDPIERTLVLQGVQTGKLLYRLGEAGSVQVNVRNDAEMPRPAHLTVAVESGLAQSTVIYDQDVTIPVPAHADEPAVLPVPLPAQAEYGHAVIATLRQGTESQSAREYFYVSNRPAQIGQLGGMGVGTAYTAEDAAAFVAQMRRHYFPLYEIDFWAPDDVTMLTPPAGKDRWWSGQTLARLSTETLTQRIALGHAQGMSVLGYTDLCYDYGFRIADYFRKNPELCNWDANSADLAYGVNELEQQAREDDNERFDPANPRKARFGAAGIWGVMTGNPRALDDHIDQLVRSTKLFDWDGWRYDDRYDYDAPAVDLLGRQLPAPGMTNTAMLARLRGALAQVKPGMIYGHNMEWNQGINSAWMPMPVTAQPHAGDYYTEFLRDGGLHLQERYTNELAYHHAPWSEVAEMLWRAGYNGYRWGGYTYNILRLTGARPVDVRHLAALNLAGMSHIAYDVPDDLIGYMRLACRYADLLYGDGLTPLDPTGTLAVDAGGREVWWQRYVRCRQVAPGHRYYFVHCINPPRDAHIGAPEQLPPDVIANLRLRWTLPAGWKASAAYGLAGEGGNAVDTSVGKSGACLLTSDAVGYDLVRQVLPMTAQGQTVQVTLPALRLWSLVVLDCTGPVGDKLPAAIMALPAPAPPQPGALARAEHPRSPNVPAPRVFDAEAKSWTGVDPATGNRAPLPRVADAGASSGQAVCWNAKAAFEAYSPGVSQGRYRLTYRVKSATPPPAGATLNMMAWPNGRKWTVNDAVPLGELGPAAGWRTITREYDFGDDNGNFGIALHGGYDGLLIDSVTIAVVQPATEAQTLAARNAVHWADGVPLPPHNGLRVWVGEGLYYEHFHLLEALRRLPGAQVDEAKHWVWRERRGFNGPQWGKPAELAAYDLVVLANIDLKTLSLEQRDWLRGYVQAGGAVWLLGGPYGFGRGYWQESDLLDPILPVRMHPFDLTNDPAPLAPVAGGMLTGAWTGKPVTLWHHQFTPKPGAAVQMRAGDDPVLVTWQAGKGRVAVLGVTPLGEEPAGATPWWNWPGWDGVMEKTCRWLVGR